MNEASPIRSDEQVILFPTAASQDEQTGNWQLAVHGWIFEPESGDLGRTLFSRLVVRAVDVEMDTDEAKRLVERLHYFLVDNERNKRVPIRVNGRTSVMPPSHADGHFEGSMTITSEAASRWLESKRIPIDVALPAHDTRRFAGNVFLVPARGITLISDIDDTIKETRVGDLDEVLKQTFCRPFTAISQAAELYRRWHQAGASVHYISLSPWQLYPPLQDFLRRERFPLGPISMQPFRAKDHTAFDLFLKPFERKLAAVEQVVRRFPKRSFVLVGDSGQKDPEVYGAIARKYRSRIVAIYIRLVQDHESGDARFVEAFRDVEPDRVRLFTDFNPGWKLPVQTEE